jgi:hypothetical protein
MRNKHWKTHCKTFPGTEHKPLCRRHFSLSDLEQHRLHVSAYGDLGIRW